MMAVIRVIVRLFLHFLDDHGRGVRDLVLGELKDLFPDHLGNDEPLGLVRELVIGEILRPRGQALEDDVQKLAQVVFERGHGDDLGKVIELAVFLDERQQRVLF